MKIDLKIKHNVKLSLVLLLWVSFIGLYLLFKSTSENQQLSGWLALIGETSLDCLLAIVIFNLVLKTAFIKNKLIFLLLFNAFIFAAIADGIYNYYLNLNFFDYKGSLITILFELPFLCFLFFQSLTWYVILYFNRNGANQKNYQAYIPYLVVSILMFLLFIFGLDWKINYLSIKGIFQIFDTIFEVAGFFFAMICLSRCKNDFIRLTSIGYLVIVFSDLMIRLQVVSDITPYLSVMELLWISGLLIFFVGISKVIKQDNENLLELFSINNLQPQLCMWLLILWGTSIFLFTIGYGLCSFHYFSELHSIVPSILSFTVPVSLVAIICSHFISRKISKPLFEIENKITQFINSKNNFEELWQLQNGNFISEFRSLESFVLDAFKIYQKKHELDVKYSNLARQVAHDIRSPILALEMISAMSPELSIEKKEMVKNIVKRINRISENLFDKTIELDSGLNKGNSNTTVTMVSQEICRLVSEKKFEFINKYIQWELNLSNNDVLFANIPLDVFQRSISNIINNSIESIKEDGFVIISSHSYSEKIIIIIEDNGAGIPPNKLNEIFGKGKTFNKKNGQGLGLSYAKEKIEAAGGKILVLSELEVGTKIEIELPLIKKPAWFLNELTIIENRTCICILDSDPLIHDIWIHRFSETKLKNFFFFHEIKAFQEFITRNQYEDCLYLIDYEIEASQYNGLQLILDLKIKTNSILVTHYYTQENVINSCLSNGIKIIPKSLIRDIKIKSI